MPLIYCASHENGSYKMINLVTANRLNDPFYISTLGLTTKEGKVHYPSGWTKYLLLFSESGCGTVYLNGKSYLLEAGSAILFAPNQFLHYHATTQAPWVTYWLTFNGQSCGSLLGVQDHVLLQGNCEFIRQTVQSLWQERARTDWEEYSAAGLYHLLLLLRSRIENPRKLLTQDLQDKLADSMKYMLEYSHTDIPLSYLANLSGIGEAYYCRLFKRLNGVRPTEYLNTLRVNHACMLLQTAPEKTVEEIGYAVGFRNYTYFITTFRRLMGVSPGHYRQNPAIYQSPSFQELP